MKYGGNAAIDSRFFMVGKTETNGEASNDKLALIIQFKNIISVQHNHTYFKHKFHQFIKSFRTVILSILYSIIFFLFWKCKSEESSCFPFFLFLKVSRKTLESKFAFYLSQIDFPDVQTRRIVMTKLAGISVL